MTKYEVATPHLIEGTNILKNKLGLTDQAKLDLFEEKAFIYRSMDAPTGELSREHLCNIHRHLLQDVYEWAGELRDVPISRGTSRFCQPQFIVQEMEKVIGKIDLEQLQKMDTDQLSGALAEIIGEMNAVHPFLDGNGRSIRVYAQQIASASDHDLEIHKLKRDAWNNASEASFLKADNTMLAKILVECLTQIQEQDESPSP